MCRFVQMTPAERQKRVDEAAAAMKAAEDKVTLTPLACLSAP
jgi:hypothetical protein